MRRALTSLAFLTPLVAGQTSSSPVSKVVELLSSMSNELEAEEKTTTAAHDKKACHCKTQTASLKAGIEEDGKTMDSETAKQVAATSKNTAAGVNRSAAAKAVKEHQDSMATATALRAREAEEFTGNQLDLTQSVQALKNALVVLDKHSFMQVASSKDLKKVALVLGSQLKRYQSRLAISPVERRSLEAFIQGPTVQAYGNQSGQIIGILSEMLEDFKNDLKGMVESEATGKASHTELMREKQSLVKDGNEKQIKYNIEFNDSKAALEQARVAFAQAETSQAGRQGDLVTLNADCKTASEAYNARKTKRTEEIVAVTQAIGILNAPENFALFGRSNFSFMQISSKNSGFDKAGFVLAQAVRDGAFTDIIRAIDVMVKELDKEYQTDADKQDQCKSNIAEVNTDIATAASNIVKTKLQVEANKNEMEEAQGKIDKTIAAIAAAETTQKKLSEDRAKEHKANQENLDDQAESIRVLGQALSVLQKVFKASFLQVKARTTVNSNKVLNLIETIIGDAETNRKLTAQGEHDAQASYENEFKGLNGEIKAQTAIETTQLRIVANKETKGAELKTSLEGYEQGEKSLDMKKEAFHDDCDGLLKNFETRRVHRDEEKIALNEAKAFLKNMN